MNKGTQYRESILLNSLSEMTNHKNMLLEYATGVGKTRIALEMMKAAKVDRLLILVPERAGIKTWKAEMKKWGVENTFHCNIACYNSIKLHECPYDGIILDEAHHACSNLRLNSLKNIQYGKAVLLSATIDDERKKALTKTIGDMHCLSVTLDDAISNEVLAAPKVNVLMVKLDNKEQSEFVGKVYGNGVDVVTTTYKRMFDWFKIAKQKGNMTINAICTQAQKYDYIENAIKNILYVANGKKTSALYTMHKKMCLDRNRWLGRIKTPHVKRLIESLGDKRIICFCSSVEQAVELGGDLALYADMPEKRKAQILEDFQSEKTHILYVVGMLQEGANLNNIEVGIIVQLEGNDRSFIQKTGRVLRSDNPVQYIFCMRNTKDMDYYKDFVKENINGRYIEEIEY